MAVSYSKGKGLDLGTVEGLAVIALIGFGVFEISKIINGIGTGAKSVTDALGLTTSANTAAVDAKANDPGSYWSPNFWQSVGGTILTNAAADNLITQIVGAYTWYDTEHAPVIGAFKSLTTQVQLSYLVYRFAQTQGGDLLSWLRDVDIVDTWPYHRLSDDEIAGLNTYFDGLPVS